MAYAFKRTFTVDHTKVGASDATAFPVLICGTITQFKTVGNSGHIQNTVSFNGVTVPADLCFYSDSGLTTAIPFDWFLYDATTGKFAVFVKRDISHTSDTAIYCGYDDSGVTTYQGGSVGAAWDSNYVCVYHLGDGSTLSVKDSTSNGRNLTNTGTHVTAGSGPSTPLGAGVFNGTNGDLVTSAFTLGETTSLTIEGWYKNTSNSDNGMYFEKSAVNSSWELFQEGGIIKFRGGNTGNEVAGTTFPTAAAWHHIVAVISSSTSGKFYTDNSVNASSTIDTLGDTSTALHIGNFDNNNYFFHGSLAEIRISKSSRTADWVNANYNNQSSPSSFTSDSGESATGGGTTYTLELDAATAAFAAAIYKKAVRTLSASTASFAATLPKRAGKLHTAATASFAATLTRRAGKLLTAATASFAAALPRVTNRILTAATASWAGAVFKSTSRTITAATASFAGMAVRTTNKALAGATAAWAATLTGSHVVVMVLNAAMASFSGALVRQTDKLLTAATSSFAGQIVRRTNKLLTAATASFSATVSRNISRTLIAAMSAWAATLDALSVHVVLFEAAMASFSGVLVKRCGKLLIAAPSAFSAVLSRSTARTFTAATASFTATLSRTTSRILNASMSLFSGVLSRTTHKLLTAAMSAWSAALSTGNTLAIQFDAAMASFSGSLVKRTSRLLTASMSSFVGQLVKSTSKHITAAMASFAGALLAGTGRLVAAFFTSIRVIQSALTTSIRTKPNASFSNIKTDPNATADSFEDEA